MSESPECVGLVGHVFGHRMRPRYTTATMDPPWLAEAARRGLRARVEAKDELTTYIADVCERCGFQRKDGAA